MAGKQLCRVLGVLCVSGMAQAAPPAVSITSPTTSTTYFAPATLTITANASDSDGTVTRVEFYQGSTLLGTDTTAPYSYQWGSVPVGSYALTAKAVDNNNESTVSAQVNIGVNTGPLTAPVRFTYDAMGRMTGYGSTVAGSPFYQYQYDSVGNITSIGAIASGQVAVLGFNPGKGGVGTVVILDGVGFSSTPANNSVTFNGVAATVTAASASQLTVVVPTGATTGPINVSAPGGSAASPGSFTVLPAPVISSFSPSGGAAGTTVSISGSNFSVPDTKVFIGSKRATLTSLSATAITALVPTGTASGRIKASTALGTAISSADFILPPYGYSNSDIDGTYRMAIGGTATLAVSTPNKISLMLFDAAASQKVSLVINSSNFGSCSSGLMKIIGPDGVNQLIQGSICSGDSINSTQLPLAGTYTLMVDPASTSTGSMNFTLYDAPDAVSAITVDGSDATATTTIPGQLAVVTFNATSGQRVFLRDITDSYAQDVVTRVYKPAANGKASTTNGWIYLNGLNTGDNTDTLAAPITGTYTILLDPAGTNTGSMTLRLTSVLPDATGSLNIGGADTVIGTTSIGQNAILTFSGTAAQKIFLRDITDTYPASLGVFIYKPDANGNASMSDGYLYVGGWNTGSNTDAQTLPSTGTYTVYLNPANLDTGSVTLRLTNVPADFSGSVTINGAALPVSITSPGQNASITFPGTAGQSVTIRSTNSTLGTKELKLLRPDGSTQASTSLATLGPQTLASTGTYTVIVNPSGANTGTVNIAVTSP